MNNPTMNNQIFNAARFSAYFKKYIVEKRNSIMVCTGVLLLLPVVYCLAYPYLVDCYYPDAYYNFPDHIPDPMWRPELSMFIIMLGIAALYCSDFYSVISQKKERIAVFTCPASNFEKFATYFIIYAVAYPLLLVLFFFLADALRVWIYRATTDGLSCIQYISPKYLLTFGNTLDYAYLYQVDILNGNELNADIIEYFRTSAFIKYSITLLTGLFIQALFALGSVIWSKKSAFKTICFLMAFGILSGFLFYFGMRTFYSSPIHIINIEPRDFGISTDKGITIFYDIIAICIIIFTWVVSYFRFKEWEVIKRW